jgi:hypothetical protein
MGSIMKKKSVPFLILVLTGFGAFAQSTDPVILSYQRNFIRSSMSTKIDLLIDASRITAVNMTPLYADALAFAVEKYPYLGADQQLLDIASTAAANGSSFNDPALIPSLRAAFTGINESRVRIACLSAFAALAKGNPELVDYLNGWFASNLSASSADVKSLSVCAAVLGKAANKSSFPVLFAAMTGKGDSAVVSSARDALNMIDDGYTANIIAIIEKRDVYSMQAAWSLASQKKSMANNDRGLIAERTFAVASEIASAGNSADRDALAAVIGESLSTLAELSWAPASPAVVQYFYALQEQNRTGAPSSVETIIPVVQCMGTMGTSDAAQSLAIFLGLLNSGMEQTKAYSEPLMLAVIKSLGDLGDKSAFDYLLYVGYLDYSETVKKASRDALARLAW